MQIIVELETQTGKSITEKINAKCIEFAEKIALKRNKNCMILTSYEDRKQSRKSNMKMKW